MLRTSSGVILNNSFDSVKPIGGGQTKHKLNLTNAIPRTTA